MKYVKWEISAFYTKLKSFTSMLLSWFSFATQFFVISEICFNLEVTSIPVQYDNNKQSEKNKHMQLKHA